MNKYVIVGGGTAGWISAAILSNLLKHSNSSVVLVESPDVPTIGVGEATIPSILDLLDYLNIPRQAFIAETDATFKLGIKFVDWLEQDHHYWHPFGTVGGKIDTLPFFHHWHKFAKQGLAGEFTDYSPATVMAQHNKFYVADPNKPDLFSSSDYALHFDAAKVAQFLQKYALNNKVEHRLSNVNKVNKGTDGLIHSLQLSDGSTLSGDFFIDCTGQKALLIGETLGVGYDDWSEFLPVDRAIAVQTEKMATLPPYTESTAHEHGWRWRIPLQSRTGNGYVYCSKFCSEQTALDLLLSNLEGPTVNDPLFIKFVTGKRQKIWHQNCLAVGLSSGFLEPLESTSIYLIMKAMLNFVQMLPQQQLYQASIDEFNRLMDIEFECIRDFIVLHYCATRRNDSEFWQWWQQAAIPSSLSNKLALFKAQGRLMRNDLDLFALDSWYSVLVGMGIEPEGHDPISDLSPPEKIEQMLTQRRQGLASAVTQLPSHNDFINKLVM